MNQIESCFKYPAWWFTSLLLSLLAAGCGGGGGGQDSILGGGGLGGGGLAALAPRVTATNPVPGATGIGVNTKIITVAFSKPMDPASLTAASFTLACPVAVAGGAVTYTATGNLATLTLPAANLPASAVCTGTVSTTAKDTTGISLANNFTWAFTTGLAPDSSAPTVTGTVNANGATNVALNTKVGATFSEAMDPATITATSFTLAQGATPVAGTVTYFGVNAVFTPAGNLAANTLYTATVTTGAKDAAGNAMAANYVWIWTTGATADTTAPTVTGTIHANGAANVAINTQVGATFSEAMDPLSITNTNFALTQGATVVAGTVTYSGVSAGFAPTSNLAANTTYTVTVKGGAVGVKDLAGNVMAADFVIAWTTAAAADTTAPTVASTNPFNASIGVCTNKTINATFSEAMDPLTITTATFTLAVTSGASATGVVDYDALTKIATFNPVANLTGTPATNYTATIKGGASGVKDLAGNPLAADSVSTFTTNASTCTTAPPLGAAAPFGGFGGSATLTSDGFGTVINGDIGVLAASTKITGLRDSGGNVYTVTTSNDGKVNGQVYTLTAPPGSVAGDAVTKARAAALVAFNSLSPASLPGGIDVSSLAQCPSCGGAGQGPGQLAGRTLPPGVYLSTTGTYGIGITVPTAGNLTLDAGGDANAVWVFQAAAGTGTLTVGVTGPATPAVPIQVLLINGAKPKNVFWYVPGGATIGTGSTMVGTILSDASTTLSTTGGGPPPNAVTTTLNGRAIALTAGVTMTNTVINVPAP